ncbi:hypothetical protein [Streptomyces antibioticus]|uniref:hypothetical protein n=1 Tax=Streptomyces antibioticus TaxID=1890 RepID=UPI0036AA3578
MTSPSGGSDHGGSPKESGALRCDRCGTRAGDPPPVTWTCSVEHGIRRHYCETCSRDNLRAIEGRLDSEWW